MSAQPKLMTEAEYLRMERASPTRHEFYQGRIYEMNPSSATHSIIVSNTLASIHAQLRRSHCQVYAIAMRIMIPQSGLYTYPDVVIVCGQSLFRDDERDTLINPVVVIEVLSPSTERYDRGMKFQHYGKLETVRDYMLIAQEQRRIDHFVRQSTGQWLLHEITNDDQHVLIESVGCTLSLEDVYEKVELSAPLQGVTRDIPAE